MVTKRNTAVPAKAVVKRVQKGVPKTKHVNVDWDGARLAYVTGELVSMVAVAQKFGVPKGLLTKRASRESWSEQKRQFSAELTETVIEEKIDKVRERLKAWNEETMQHAEWLREAAQRQFMYEVATARGGKITTRWRFKKDTPAKAIQAAAGAHVTADKLARLALGASTENHDNVNRSLPVTVDDFV